MAGRFPALDLHAHIDATIAPAELTPFTGIVFAASRTFAESQTALQRRDPRVIWGAGCHPGLARNHTTFDADRFEGLVQRTPYVSEIGLDGSSKGGLDRQIVTLESILTILQRHPRITSIHSQGARDETLICLERLPIRGAILHWWLGNPEQTQKAVELGCYFSMNLKAMKRVDSVGTIPLERMLPETDHPFGDSISRQPRIPGNTSTVETAIGKHYGMNQGQIRSAMWSNLSRLVRQVECGRLMSRSVLRYLAAAS